MAKKKEMMLKIQELEAQLAEQKGSEGGETVNGTLLEKILRTEVPKEHTGKKSDAPKEVVPDEPVSTDVAEESKEAPKAEDPKEAPKADKPKDDAPKKADKPTEAVVAGSEKRSQKADAAPESDPEDDELDGLTAEELTSMAQQMQRQMAKAKKKLETAEAKMMTIMAKADEKAKAEAEAKRIAAEKAAEEQAKAEAEAKAKADAKAAESENLGGNGPLKIFKYWSTKEKTWKYTEDIWAANQISPNLWMPVWVFMKNGKVDHFLSEEEIEELLP